MKRVLLITLLLAYPLARFCHHQTKGFRASKLTGNQSCIPEDTSSNMPLELQEICKQRFTYFGRGLQSFSFVSEDGTTILKLFNNRYRRLLSIMRLPIVRTFKQERIAQLERKWVRTFHSYHLASVLLKNESGLLYYHPSTSQNCPSVTIVDPLGSPHLIDLSKHAFALQKRAMGSFEFFRICAENHEHEKARKGLASLIGLMKKKAALGLCDNDPLIRTNIGFIDGIAMQIDLGPFSESDSSWSKKQLNEEIKQNLKSLRSFMESETPSLLFLIDEAIDQL